MSLQVADALRIPMEDLRAVELARRHVPDLYMDLWQRHAIRIQKNPHVYCHHERCICLVAVGVEW